MINQIKHQIPSVNFHLWEPCNMRCKFCFAGFKDVKQSVLPKGHLPREQAVQVVQQLADLGFEKITFAGGEPTLCSWLSDLISTAKQAGLTTMIVSNGSKLTDKFLQENKKHLDWIAISVDSLNIDTNTAMGRALSGKTAILPDTYFDLADKIKQYGFGFKVNTVVNRLNFTENMSEFIRYSKPKRWKIFQVLPMVGQNDLYIDDFKITDEQFQQFLHNHANLHELTKMIPENNSQMKGSYAMVDPAGRFYDNANGTHNYSKPILEIGARKAIQQVDYNFDKFILREGLYDWKIKNSSKNDSK
jgi:radical S-adenosyl methionine domain-containing protein 2